ncbi:MAG: hypothetical protein WD052_11950 [Bacteroidales bacterium]
MKTSYYISVIVLFLAVSVSAQDQIQAFRFSQVYPVGTARYTSMGGAFGAIGGDFTAASQNPAGLGIFRNSEFTITPSYILNNSRSKYLGESNRDFATNMSIGNLGLVTSYNTGRNEGLAGATFAFGYNALNNFHSTALMHGINENTSLLDNFAWYANNNNELDIFYEDLANEIGLMPLDTVQNEYWHYLQPYDDIGYDGYGQEQIRVLERRGNIGEYAFSAAMNISHKLYLGGTVGIHSVRFYEDIYQKETDINDLEPEFESFRFGEYNSTRGYGYVFKIGLIFKPIHILRIGASFHAPVIYQLTDDKFTELNSYWDSNSGLTNDYASSGLFSKEYTLRTPYRASLSTTVLLGKLGLIAAEYEYVDYSSSDLDSPGYKFVNENSSIARDFGVAHNLKAGAEIRLNPVYLRAGAQYYMNPYTEAANGSDILVYSGGIGVKVNQTFIDVAYSLRTSSETYGLYQHFSSDVENEFEISDIAYTRTNVMVTLGYKF